MLEIVVNYKWNLCLARKEVVRNSYAHINSTTAEPLGGQLQGKFAYASWLVALLVDISFTQNTALKGTEVLLQF